MLKAAFEMVRYLLETREFLRDTVTVERARETLERQHKGRSEAFLDLMDRVVYADPRHPYHRLLENAGIEFAGLKGLVSEVGLEGTLERLHDAGVYLTAAEAKGRQPVRRPGLEFWVKPSELDNPLIRESALKNSTTGTTGQPINVAVPLERLEYRSAETLLVELADVQGRPLATWTDGSIRNYMRHGKVNLMPDKHYSTVGFRRSREGLQYIALLNATLLASRLAGMPAPRPEIVRLDEAVKIARWLAQQTAAGTPGVVHCHVAGGVRICIAADEHNLDIRGTLFLVSGEPYTPAKAAILHKVGATAKIRYSMAETAMIGVSCTEHHPDAELDDVHLLESRVAMIQREITTPAGDNVGALVYTTLLRSNPKLLLNVYSGDYANVSRRECGCFLGELGLRTHLGSIRSYEKLTGEAVTFLASNLFNLVEEVLPRTFGGYVQCYQLVEEEAENGLPKLSIVISERVGPVDEAAVIRTVMENLKATHHRAGGELMSEIWRQGNTLRVVRREPRESGGKIAPLRLRPRGAEASVEISQAQAG